MENLSVPRLLISGERSGVGKSLVTLGLVHELRRRGVSVSCAVVGPNLLNAALLRRISGRYVRSLDSKLLTPRQLMVSLYLGGVGADVLLVEGGGALFDGVDPTSVRGSDAELAQLAQIPTLALLDGRGCRATAAVILRGLASAAQGFDVIGGLINRSPAKTYSDDSEKAFYDQAVQHWLSKPIFGVLPELELNDKPPPSGASQRNNVISLSRQFFVDLGKTVQQSVNIDGLLVCAGDAEILQIPDFTHGPAPRRCRIGVAEDACFTVGYQDNIELLRYFGAEIVTFSPLADDELPKRLGGVYLPGGFLQEYSRDLAENRKIRESIRAFVDGGGVLYSEGHGTAYLSAEYRFDDQEGPFPGVGVLPCALQPGRGGHSYVQAVTTEESVIGRGGQMLRGLYADDWKLVREDRMPKLLRISRGTGSPLVEGFSPGAQVLCTFGLFHWGATPDVARALVDAAEVVEAI